MINYDKHYSWLVIKNGDQYKDGSGLDIKKSIGVDPEITWIEFRPKKLSLPLIGFEVELGMKLLFYRIWKRDYIEQFYVDEPELALQKREQPKKKYQVIGYKREIEIVSIIDLDNGRLELKEIKNG